MPATGLILNGGYGFGCFLLNPNIYIISRIASVFTTSRTMNQTRCLFLAVLHKATPFQGRDQAIAINVNIEAQNGIAGKIDSIILTPSTMLIRISNTRIILKWPLFYNQVQAGNSLFLLSRHPPQCSYFFSTACHCIIIKGRNIADEYCIQ